jgi:hypothetical protein
MCSSMTTSPQRLATLGQPRWCASLHLTASRCDCGFGFDLVQDNPTLHDRHIRTHTHTQTQTHTNTNTHTHTRTHTHTHTHTHTQSTTAPYSHPLGHNHSTTNSLSYIHLTTPTWSPPLGPTHSLDHTLTKLHPPHQTHGITPSCQSQPVCKFIAHT